MLRLNSPYFLFLVACSWQEFDKIIFHNGAIKRCSKIYIGFGNDEVLLEQKSLQKV